MTLNLFFLVYKLFPRPGTLKTLTIKIHHYFSPWVNGQLLMAWSMQQGYQCFCALATLAACVCVNHKSQYAAESRLLMRYALPHSTQAPVSVPLAFFLLFTPIVMALNPAENSFLAGQAVINYTTHTAQHTETRI